MPPRNVERGCAWHATRDAAPADVTEMLEQRMRAVRAAVAAAHEAVGRGAASAPPATEIAAALDECAMARRAIARNLNADADADAVAVAVGAERELRALDAQMELLVRDVAARRRAVPAGARG